MIFDLILIIVFGVIMAKRIKSNNKKNTNEIGLNDKKLEEILFPKSGEKNKEIKRYLAFAGPLSAKNYSACNKFKSGDYIQWKNAMERDWGIENRNDFFKQVEELLNDDIYYYDILIPVINKNDSRDIYKYLLDKGCNKNYSECYSKVIPQITQNFNALKIPLPNKTLIAWNLVRAAFLALSAEAAGYIERKDSLDILEKVSIKANEYYCDWSEYAGSFN